MVRREGFTLVELLITLSIVAILMGVMAPKISALFQNPSEKTATLIRHAVMRARWLAARDQVPVFLIFNRKSQEILLQEVRKEKTETLSTMKLPSGVKMVGFWNQDPGAKGVMKLRFLPDGRGEGFGVHLEEGAARLTVMGYPYRSGVEVIDGWIEGAPHGA